MKNNTWIKYYESGQFKEQITFDEADLRIIAKSKELISFGIKPDNRVIVQLPNSPDAVITYFAIYKIGAIVVPIGMSETGERFEYIASDCNAKARITTDGLKILKNNAESYKFVSGSISTIIYTSGTTGEPKGVCLSKENWIENANSLIKHHNLNNQTVFASPLLLTHCNAHGLSMFSTYIARCKWILFDKVPPNLLEIISNEKASILSLVPSILYRLFEENKHWTPYQQLKYILTAAAPLSSNLLIKVKSSWNIKIIQGYGLSESTNFSCTLPIDLNDDDYESIMFPKPSVGIAIDNVEIKIGESNSPELVKGELFIRSKSNFLGYWGKKQNKCSSWVQTGDIGYYKIFFGQKYYYLDGRIKEIINRGGEKISPIELENEICNLGLEIEIAIITIPSEQYGEDIGLVCTKSFDFSILNLLPKYRRPRKVYLMDRLFYTPTSKLQRKILSQYCQANPRYLISE